MIILPTSLLYATSTGDTYRVDNMFVDTVDKILHN